MKLPRSFREVRAAINRSGSGAAFIDMGRRASSFAQVQGTRASAWQGTASAGNTPNPLVPGQSVTPNRPPGWDDPDETAPILQFSTFAPTAPVDGAATTTRDWPPNASRDSIAPNSGHREQVDMSGQLQMGEGPGRILRSIPNRVFGVVGITTGQRGSEDGVYSIADKDYLRHIPVARMAQGIVQIKVSDDNAVIPAVYAGNPRA
jgi:hypothetical protein